MEGSLDGAGTQVESVWLIRRTTMVRSFHLDKPHTFRHAAYMLADLRDVAVATMIASQFTIGIVQAVAGNWREAAIGTLLATVNVLIFWIR